VDFLVQSFPPESVVRSCVFMWSMVQTGGYFASEVFFFSFSGWWILWLAVSFGYSSVDDYYYDSSSAHSIKDVKIPLLCIQAENDPIAPARGIPRADIEVDSMFTILLYFFLCCNVFPGL
jgi:hypothetical protein